MASSPRLDDGDSNLAGLYRLAAAKGPATVWAFFQGIEHWNWIIRHLAFTTSSRGARLFRRRSPAASRGANCWGQAQTQL